MNNQSFVNRNAVHLYPIVFILHIVKCNWEDGYNMIDIIQKLDELKSQYNWSNYQIARKCGLSDSTIKNIYNRKSIPHIDTLEIICDAFGISLSQFLLEDSENFVPLNDEQKELFDKWKILTKEQKNLVNDFIMLLYKSNNFNENS